MTKDLLSFFFNPCSTMKVSNLPCHCLGTFLRPHKLFHNQQTRSSLLRHWSLWVAPCRSFSKSPWRKAVFTYSCLISKFMLAAKLSTTRIDYIFTSDKKISSKPMPFLWPKPFTTNCPSWAFLFALQLEHPFILKGLLPLGNFTRLNLWFLCKASII